MKENIKILFSENDQEYVFENWNKSIFGKNKQK